ncbi:hypothetical protein BXZ70DRAFT_914121 [Cristinia sonorae]|uniref:Uncharacterized protein n=1 Tax=Cristinia sonorae TaxID=1940300 RepID=A0A8K0V2H7_9AGAR|nr:hypothetical protein BXZ70DRAFT_914121 [Cristinia sonorae]
MLDCLLIKDDCGRNLMIDTFLANAAPDDLRAIVRATLATCPHSTTATLTHAARVHFEHRKAPSVSEGLFTVQDNGLSVPAAGLQKVLSRARVLYGVGSAFSSLSVLEGVIRATAGLKWEEEGQMADALAMVDADITQAIQSCKEELGSGRVKDLSGARKAVASIGEAINAVRADCARWDEDAFPFDRAEASVQYWKF